MLSAVVIPGYEKGRCIGSLARPLVFSPPRQALLDVPRAEESPRSAPFWPSVSHWSVAVQQSRPHPESGGQRTLLKEIKMTRATDGKQFLALRGAGVLGAGMITIAVLASGTPTSQAVEQATTPPVESSSGNGPTGYFPDQFANPGSDIVAAHIEAF